ncbi:hypothetical protein GE061_007381 [Apolygus lucorum]|uniref:Cystatin domain-containing protein n=1 Tax=Apolygus lucorum TaxID=248454 RepID=A0A8S9WVK3_APOLU|nr:hypothetical protein GE061_007381 [Apolygus lucorum]
MFGMFGNWTFFWIVVSLLMVANSADPWAYKQYALKVAERRGLKVERVVNMAIQEKNGIKRILILYSVLKHSCVLQINTDKDSKKPNSISCKRFILGNLRSLKGRFDKRYLPMELKATVIAFISLIVVVSADYSGPHTKFVMKVADRRSITIEKIINVVVQRAANGNRRFIAYYTFKGYGCLMNIRMLNGEKKPEDMTKYLGLHLAVFFLFVSWEFGIAEEQNDRKQALRERRSLCSRIARSRGFEPFRILKIAKQDTGSEQNIVLTMMYKVADGINCMMYLFFEKEMCFDCVTQVQTACQ